MVAIQPKAERNLDGYGAPPIAWDRVRRRLDEGFTQPPMSGGPSRHTWWLTTVNPDGSPHVMPLGVLWVDGALYFNSGSGTRKSQNLAQNPHCALFFPPPLRGRVRVGGLRPEELRPALFDVGGAPVDERDRPDDDEDEDHAEADLVQIEVRDQVP